jgi:autotransporter-associated beta strand protein
VVSNSSTLGLAASGAVSSGTVTFTGSNHRMLIKDAPQVQSNVFVVPNDLSITVYGIGGTAKFAGDLQMLGTRSLTINCTSDAPQVFAFTGSLESYSSATNSIIFNGDGDSLVLWRPSSLTGTGAMYLNGTFLFDINSAASILPGSVATTSVTLVFNNFDWATGGSNVPLGVMAARIAARGTQALVISTGSNNMFDRDIMLGSGYNDPSGNLWADADIDIAIDTVLTGVRNLSPYWNGPSMVGPMTDGVKYSISGALTGSGAVTMNLSSGAQGRDYWLSNFEMVLSGSNKSWTGSPGLVNLGDNGSMDVGGGGLLIGGDAAANHGIVRFDGQDSLPTGRTPSTTNVTAFLGIARKGGEHGYLNAGFMLTSKPGGATYELPSGLAFLIGSVGDSQYIKPCMLGASSDDGVAGTAILANSKIYSNSPTVDLASSYPNAGNAHPGGGYGAMMGIIARDGAFVLGADDKPVTFVPTASIFDGSKYVVSTTQIQDINVNGNRALMAGGLGVVILSNVKYESLSGTALPGQFIWQAGEGVSKQVGYQHGDAPRLFSGMLRETGNDASNSTLYTGLRLTCGVLQPYGTSFTRSLGTGAGQVDWYHGGFSAYYSDLEVNIGGAGDTLIAGTNLFMTAEAHQPLIFGSLTNRYTTTLVNGIQTGWSVSDTETFTRTVTIATVKGSEAGATVVLAGELSGSEGFVFTNAVDWAGSTAYTAGSVVLAGTLSYSGTTYVDAGTVLFNSIATTSASPVIVAGGATIGGTGVLDRPVILGTGAILSPGNSIGSLGMQSLSLSSNLLLWDLAAGSAADLVYFDGDLSAQGVSTFTFSGSFGAGTYALIDYGTFSGTLSNFALNGSAPEGLNWLLSDSAGKIQLVVYGSANQWASATGGDWSTGTNWTGGVPNAIGAEANFGSNLASADTVNLDIAPTVGAIKFDNANKYTIGGTYTLTLATSSGNASIQVDTGSHEIAAPVTLGSDLAANIAGDLLTISGPMDGPYGVTKTGAGKLEINGTATYTGTTHVVNGELSLGAAQTLGAVVIDSSALVTLTNGATQISSLEIAGGSSAPEAKLDIMSSALIIDYSGSESPLAEIEALIIKGYNGGDWAGNGITSSVLFDITAEAIGVIDNTTFLGGGLGEFAGRSIGMETVLVRKVIAGDIDMSGEVNAADYFYIDFNLDTAGGGWGAGDLDYSGETNSADYFYIDFNLGMSEGASMGTSIPEPATLVLLTLGGLAVVRRRR